MIYGSVGGWLLQRILLHRPASARAPAATSATASKTKGQTSSRTPGAAAQGSSRRRREQSGLKASGRSASAMELCSVPQQQGSCPGQLHALQGPAQTPRTCHPGDHKRQHQRPVLRQCRAQPVRQAGRLAARRFIARVWGCLISGAGRGRSRRGRAAGWHGGG